MSLRLEVRDRHLRPPGPLTTQRAAALDDADGVVAVGAVDGHGVRRAVTAGRPACAEVDRHLRDAGAGQVVDRDVVGAAQGVELDLLDAVEVHVMLPTSRESRTRPPLAEISMFSATLAPLNTSVSVPAPPSTMSLPSPGFHTKVSLPSPRSAKSLPWPPSTMSLPAPPISVSAPWLPVMVSLPAPPSIDEPDDAGRRGVAASMTSLPPPALTSARRSRLPRR